MQLLDYFVVGFLGLLQTSQAAITCATTADCAWGETCVAGDSDSVIQACVPSTVCGGSSMGNCPSDDRGKLACLWRPFDDCKDGCAILDGNKGMYKCVSIARCDGYYGGAACSDACYANGLQCNGQGSCSMVSSNPDGTPKFSCTCENGYSGEKCEVASTNTPLMNPSSAAGDKRLIDDNFHSDAGKNLLRDDVMERVGGASTDTADHSSTNISSRPAVDPAGTSFTETSDELPSTSNRAFDPSGSDKTPSAVRPSAATDIESLAGSPRSGVHSGVLFLLLVMAVVFLLGTVVFVAYSCKKKQQERAEEDAYALRRAGVANQRDRAERHTESTQKSHIVTM
uniref:EGF-like domain-containing protein n=1 Tax=Peronospora matthiolae TaxID=2874970 RepID=A0AAV1TSS4_9STRA